jgi:1-acyl-sn-glycerol-3-phosphate acyltransferase
MGTLRATFRLVLLILFIVPAIPVCTVIVMIARLFGSHAGDAAVMALTPLFCGTIAALMGLRITRVGRRHPLTLIFVGNHVSYLDILVAGVGVGGVFVSRHDVKDWPVIGIFARLAGTVFLDRSSLRSAVVSSSEIVRRARQGVRIAIFPEGGTSEGDEVRSFKPFLLSGIAAAEFDVQPFTIRYTHIGSDPITPANRDLIHWYDPAQAFTSHGWQVMKQRYVRVRITFHPPQSAPASSEKEEVRAFAEKLRGVVAGTA